MNTLFHEVCGDVVDDYTVHSTLMSSDDVTSAIKKLKPGKSDGYDGLSSDYYCNGTPLLSRYISALFNCMITHCYVPNSFCISTIIPIPKGSNKSTSTVKNYRGIALSSLLSKIFDNCIISLQESCLLTDDLQFAYKSKTSTVQCISTITEIINYYIKNSSNLYMCTLDCTKAFDRVSLVLLFTKLRERKMNPLVLKCLIYTYCNQKVCINWNGAKSTLFSATNGVKQGGVLSPRLFNVYLNELLSKLRENGLGCHMNGQFVGTFIYADDITILAPSHSSLQSMLTICDQYASRHHLIFNPTKTKCMFFPTNKNMKQCPVIFKNESIEFVKECCLLGFKISTDVLNRNIDATIQTFYRKCNEVRFDFSMLSSDIKSKLISTYCMDLYGSQLWNYGTGYPETFYVAWRKVTRLIWKLPFRTHCNLLHTINNCYPIEFILEKRCIKFLHSCLSSDNLVISNVAKSSCDNCYSTFGDNVRYFSHKYNIASKKWMEPFTDLLPCLFDHMHRSTPDLPVAHTIRELALCRDDNSTFLLTSVEMSQIIEYLCTI